MKENELVDITLKGLFLLANKWLLDNIGKIGTFDCGLDHHSFMACFRPVLV